MRSICLIVLCLFFAEGKAQSSKSLKAVSGIAVRDVKKTLVCKSEKLTYHFPDIYGKNEHNFFNQQLIAGYLEISGLAKGKIQTPEQLLQQVVKSRASGCREKNDYSGLNNVSFEIGINNGKVLSLTMRYEVLAGNLTIEEQHFNFDVVNKKILTANEVFRKDKIHHLTTKINNVLKERLEEYRKEPKGEEQQKAVNELLSNVANIFKKEQLEFFRILEKGIEFSADYGLPRGTIPVDPTVFLSFKELEGYLILNIKI